MKIYKIAANPMASPQANTTNQQDIQEATNDISSAIALMNKSFETLVTNQTEKLFQKDELINSIQSGDLRRIDINKVNTSLQAMSAISQSALAINQSLRDIENAGGDVNSIIGMMVTSLQTGNYSAFQASMANFQSNLTGMTGTLQAPVVAP